MIPDCRPTTFADALVGKLTRDLPPDPGVRAWFLAVHDQFLAWHGELGRVPGLEQAVRGMYRKLVEAEG